MNQLFSYKIRLLVQTTLVSILLFALPATSRAELKVIISGGFRGAYDSLIPDFEKSTGIKVTTTYGASIGPEPTTIPNQLRNGTTADVIILVRTGLDEIIAEKRIVNGSDVNLARSLIGMIVPKGSPKPDISTVEKFKQTLLQSKSIAVSTSASGTYLTTKLFPKLGIDKALTGKIIQSEPGSQVVGSGKAEIGLQQVSEVLRVPNSEFVGTIPEEIQLVTMYSAAIVSNSNHMAESKRLIDYLSSKEAAAAIRQSGMEPVNSSDKQKQKKTNQ